MDSSLLEHAPRMERLRGVLELALAAHPDQARIARLVGSGRYRTYVRPVAGEPDRWEAYLAPTRPDIEPEPEEVWYVRFPLSATDPVPIGTGH